MEQMLVPLPWQGTCADMPDFPGYEWLKKLPAKKIYLAIFQRIPETDLPQGYDHYIVSFHLEPIDIVWLQKQKVAGHIYVLSDCHHYDLQLPGISFFSFIYWHYQLANMQAWFGHKEKTLPTYKFSAVCNRVTQSKVWVITKLLECADNSSLLVLNNWIENKNVHGWQATGDAVLDQLTSTFQQKYLGQQLKVDDFANSTDNIQMITGNPWQPLYQDCAVNFTNESFAYSYMSYPDRDFVWPGPFITEKTLKCLLGGTAFVPVGQCDTYKTLIELGFEFDYGFDLAWDADPKNLSRFGSVIELIDHLNTYSAPELYTKTLHSNRHNQDIILSGKFFNLCQKKNLDTIEKIFALMA